MKQEVLPDCPEPSFDFSSSFGLIGWAVHDEDAEGCGDAGQLLRMKNLPVVHVQADRNPTRLHGLAQAIEQGDQALAQIELGVGNEADPRAARKRPL